MKSGFWALAFFFGTLSNLLAEGETETQFRINCAKFTTELAKLSPSRQIPEETLAIIKGIAAKGLQEPENRVLNWTWRKTKWPKIFTALVNFDSAVRSGNLTFDSYVEWIKAPAGSDAEARELRQLARAMNQLKILIDGEPGKPGLTELDLRAGLNMRAVETSFKDADDPEPSAEHKKAVDKVTNITRSIAQLNEQIQKLEKPAVVKPTKASPSVKPSDEAIPLVGVEPTSANPHAEQITALKQQRAQLEANLSTANADLKVFEDRAQEASSRADSKVKAARAERERIGRELEQKQGMLGKVERAYDEKARAYVVKALYQSWSVWDAYQAEIAARKQAEEDAAAKAREKADKIQAAADAKLKAQAEENRKKQAFEDYKKKAEEALAKQREAAGGGAKEGAKPGDVKAAASTSTDDFKVERKK